MDRIPEVMHARREAELPADLDGLRCNPPEIGWRLHLDFWRQGLASEAALRMAAFAFDNLAAPELVAVRHPENVASERVMDRLRMRYRGFEVWYGKMLATHAVGREEWLQPWSAGQPFRTGRSEASCRTRPKNTKQRHVRC